MFKLTKISIAEGGGDSPQINQEETFTQLQQKFSLSDIIKGQIIEERSNPQQDLKDKIFSFERKRATKNSDEANLDQQEL